MDKKVIVSILGIVVVAGGIGMLVVNRRVPPFSSDTSSGNIKSITVGNDVCADFPKEWVQQVTGKIVLKTEAIGGQVTNVCQYFVDETNFFTLRLNNLSVENQKKGQQALGRTISTNNKITMEHFIAVQEDGLINGVYLVIHPNQFLVVDRTSTKALSDEELVNFAGSVASRLKTGPTQKTTPTVPLPQETDIIRSFFAVIGEHRPSDAVTMLSADQVSDDSKKQAWAVQFNAFSSLTVTSVEPALLEDWTDSKHEYKVVLTVAMKPESASAPIPYYGWENGSNIRWVTIVKNGNLWKISGIGTGP